MGEGPKADNIVLRRSRSECIGAPMDTESASVITEYLFGGTLLIWVKIADFGVARLEASNLAEMTGYTGTPGYMAPEVLESKPYNRKCDVYSFGICLWEMYCCDMPYPNITFSELTSAVVYKNLRPEIPKQCPSSLAKVMKQCWDGEPKRMPEITTTFYNLRDE
ncbi:unnamed protein product [Prunus armeniaca]